MKAKELLQYVEALNDTLGGDAEVVLAVEGEPWATPARITRLAMEAPVDADAVPMITLYRSKEVSHP